MRGSSLASSRSRMCMAIMVVSSSSVSTYLQAQHGIWSGRGLRYRLIKVLNSAVGCLILGQGC